MKKFVIGIFVLSAISAQSSHAAAFLADLTLSPVKTVLEVIVSPTATLVGAVLASTDSAANRQAVIDAAASDAADHLGGAPATPLLQEVHSLLREELVRRGDLHPYTDIELSKMIAAEVSAL